MLASRAEDNAEGVGNKPPVAARSMRAVVQDSYGSADVLHVTQVEMPTIGDGEVLLHVRAAGLHIGDWHLMTGMPYLMRVMGFGLRAPKARIRGTDVAGTIEAVGAEVTGLRVGDEVYGTCDGSFAEYAITRANTVALKPANLTFEAASAVPTSACTALQALRAAGDVGPGQQVLVIGASGGVGLFAVQIGKSLGAEVTGVCSTAKVDLVRSVGADHVVDYTREELGGAGGRYDVILDLGGTRTVSQLRRLLRPQGRLVLVGGEGGGRWVGGAMVRSLRALALSPFVSQKLRMIFARATAEDLRVLRGLIEAGRVNPVVAKTYPLTQAADAMRDLHAGQAGGKLVITN